MVKINANIISVIVNSSRLNPCSFGIKKTQLLHRIKVTNPLTAIARKEGLFSPILRKLFLNLLFYNEIL